jgi:hypothetical protein
MTDRDMLLEYSREKVEQDEPRRDGNGNARENAGPFPFTMAKDITLEPKEFLIDGFLGRDEVSAWYGPPDAGKSTVLIHAACCVAAGLEFCGQRVRQGPVLYVAAERGAIARRRIKAWCKEHGLEDIPLAVVDQAIDLRTSKIDVERIIATARELETVCGQRVVWIIFDTLNRILAGGDENSSKDMGAVIASIDHIHRATRAHISFIHHVPVDRVDRMRGHGSALGAMDTTVRVIKQHGIVQIETDVAKDLVDKPCFTFTFKSVVLLTDRETKVETTAPVMVEIKGDGKPMPRPHAKLPKAAKIALRALREAIDELGQVPPASNHIPANLRVVSFDQWRDYAYRLGISASEKPRARQAAFQRASQHLIADHHASAWSEQAWIGGKKAEAPREPLVAAE